MVCVATSNAAGCCSLFYTRDIAKRLTTPTNDPQGFIDEGESYQIIWRNCRPHTTPLKKGGGEEEKTKQIGTTRDII
jgi:hypothetical protein